MASLAFHPLLLLRSLQSLSSRCSQPKERDDGAPGQLGLHDVTGKTMGSGRMEEGAVPSDWGQAAGFIEEVTALEYRFKD